MVSGDTYCYLGDCLDEAPVETKRLILKNSMEADIPGLVDVFMSCGYMQAYTGHEHRPEDIRKALNEGSLPPGGFRAFYYMKTVIEKDSGRIAGLLEYSHGYPDKNTLWISFLLLHKDAQQKGLGTELMNAFIRAIDKTYLNTVPSASIKRTHRP